MLHNTNVVILPAALSDNEEELKAQIEKISPLSEDLHVDYSDGAFVASKTVDWQLLLDLPEYYFNNNFYLHLMCQRPLAIAKTALRQGFAGVTLHVEAVNNSDLAEIKLLGQYGAVGLAIKIGTPLAKIAPYIKLVDSITVMTIEAGGQGREFQKNGLENIKGLRVQGYKGTIIADGGINETTIEETIAAGADKLVVGSALVKSDNPQETFIRLLAQIESGIARKI